MASFKWPTQNDLRGMFDKLFVCFFIMFLGLFHLHALAYMLCFLIFVSLINISVSKSVCLSVYMYFLCSSFLFIFFLFFSRMVVSILPLLFSFSFLYFLFLMFVFFLMKKIKNGVAFNVWEKWRGSGRSLGGEQ